MIFKQTRDIRDIHKKKTYENCIKINIADKSMCVANLIWKVHNNSTPSMAGECQGPEGPPHLGDNLSSSYTPFVLDLMERDISPCGNMSHQSRIITNCRNAISMFVISDKAR